MSATPGDPVDDLVAGLYARPVEEFTAARDDLVRRLRRDGDGEAAARIAALRRPAMPLWLANQVAHRHPDAMARALEAGARLRQAQGRAVSGDREAARELVGLAEHERTAVAALARLAADLLRGAERTDAPARALPGIVHAAAVGDDDVREALRAGRLTAEPASPGFGDVVPAPAPTAGPAEERAPEDAAAAEEMRRRALEAAREERAAARERAGEARRLRAEAERLAGRAAAAEDEARAAREEANRAGRAADAAEAEAARAERGARAAETEAGLTDPTG